MATFDAENPGPIPYRVTLLERWQGEQVEWRREVDEDRVNLRTLRNDVRTLKRIAITLLVSVISGSTAITIAVLLSTRGHA